MVSRSKFSDSDVLNEGFTPLRKAATQPVGVEINPLEEKRFSFSYKFASDAPAAVWDRSPWVHLRRNASFAAAQAGDVTPRQAAKNEAVAIVDPFSTGAHLAKYVTQCGYRCIRVFSIYNSPVAALVQADMKLDFDATIQHDDNAADQDAAVNHTAQQLRDLPWPVVAVIPGAETGVELSDRLSSRMGLPTNGEELTEARRNKFVMGETVRAAGVRAVKQKLATTMADIEAFLADHKPDPFMCVVKPVESAGTDDVFLCSTPDEARKAFRAVYGKKNGIGLINDAVLIQEFLRGKEYVVDSVSLNGVHKVVAVWQYDKRACNGANFIYHGMRLRNPEEPHIRRMIEYSRLVLDALKVNIGPSHMEIMDCEDGPCLVEVGTRCHGGEGTWIPVAMECVGYSMEKVTLDAYVNPARWEALPPAPLRMLKYGWETDMVNRHPGIIRGYPGEQILRSLASFRSLSWDVKIGDFAPLTKDLFTRPGCVQLIHESEEQVDKDFEVVHQLEEMGLFDYSVICPEPPPTGAVVVVDPFSSGANLAAMVAKMGYKLIMLFSELDSAITGLVSAGAKVTPQATIQHDNLSANQEAAVEQTLEALRNQNAPIVAIIAGAETGVGLADSLATRFRTRNNGERLSTARRDKHLMHETVASKGVRAIRQARCENPADVSAFLRGFGKFPVVVKPIQSSGSDSVMLCHNETEALEAFAKIFGKVNNIGRPNAAVLVQEYVEGPEFVIDTVSRDGKHKIVAVWEYDKRPVNGAPFVYHGMRLRATAGDHRMQSVIAYARDVLNALEIFQGPSHMEVIWTRDGPCLVEVGARCHGGEATWLPVVNECLGYNQLEATLDCYLRPDRFDNLPPEPFVLRKQGAELFLVSTFSGVLRDVPGVEVLRSLESFRGMELSIQPGSNIVRTVDCFTRPGSVQLVNDFAEGLQADYERVRALEAHGLFEVHATAQVV